MTALAGGCVEAEDDAPTERLREGKDFASAEELRSLTAGSPRRTARRRVAERLAEVIEWEVRWLLLAGQTPGGLPWDRQPAWRVRLWEYFIEEQERAAMMADAITTW